MTNRLIKPDRNISIRGAFLNPIKVTDHILLSFWAVFAAVSYFRGKWNFADLQLGYVIDVAFKGVFWFTLVLGFFAILFFLVHRNNNASSFVDNE